MRTRHRVVILGGGFGGLVTARRLLKLADETPDVVLVDRSNVHVYTPWLYEVATGSLMDNVRGSFHELKTVSGVPFHVLDDAYGAHFRFRRAAVTGCDIKNSHVLLEDGKTLAYDTLVVALGAVVNDYGVPGVREHAISLTSLDAAQAVHSQLEELLDDVKKGGQSHVRVVVAGGGATGTELSAELANFVQRCEREGLIPAGKFHIILAEAGGSVLGGQKKVSQDWARERLDALGVDVREKTSVARVEEDHVIFGSPGKTKTRVPCSLVVWAGGVKPNSALKEMNLPLTEKGAVKVDDNLRVRGMERIFALGDCAALVSPKTGKPVPPLAQAAIKEANLAAKNILCELKGIPMRSFSFPGKWTTITPVGGKFALMHADIPLKGKMVYWVHRLIDLRYFFRILPWRQAWRAWRSAGKLFSQND